MAKNDGKEPHLIPPDETAAAAATQILLAEVKNYTERPDLFLEMIERHDPGFIKRLNADAKAHAEKLRAGTFNFGRFQAYIVLLLQVVLSLATLAVLATAVIYNQAGASIIISLGIVLAIILSGPSGFAAIAATIDQWLRRRGD